MSILCFTYYTDATERCATDGRDDDTRGFPIFTYSIPLFAPSALSQLAQHMQLVKVTTINTCVNRILRQLEEKP